MATQRELTETTLSSFLSIHFNIHRILYKKPLIISFHFPLPMFLEVLLSWYISDGIGFFSPSFLSVIMDLSASVHWRAPLPFRGAHALLSSLSCSPRHFVPARENAVEFLLHFLISYFNGWKVGRFNFVNKNTCKVIFIIIFHWLL